MGAVKIRVQTVDKNIIEIHSTPVHQFMSCEVNSSARKQMCSERFLRQLTEFAGENGMSAGPLRALMKSVLLLPHGALKRNLTAEQVKADLLSLGLNEDKARHFSDQWRIHYPVLSRLAVGQTLMVNQLVDMEWKFGVTVGTSELQKTGNIFLQLKLVIRKGNTTENVYMELTLPQFYNFLHEMERAKASMDCFS
uniref:COMM domain containing 7 n=1 Tax=Cyprinus carpio carpio TaxID=630221 RepID=A0A9J8C6P6_CYPCA